MSDIGAMMAAACDAGGVQAAGLALRRRQGSPLDITVGLSDPGAGTPATPDTPFHIGSVTKAMTAELVHDQIAAGRLSLDMDLLAAAPELARITGLQDRTVTLGQLLSHSSGLDGDVIFDAGDGPDVLRRYLSRIDRLDFLFPPGQSFSYANLGYGLLGRVVEIAAGSSFETLLTQHLRDRYGLHRFAMAPAEKQRIGVACCFVDGQPVEAGPYSNLASGTMLAMVPGDLARWGLNLRLADTMGRLAVPTPFAYRYRGWGHGLMCFDTGARPVLGHDGGTAGTVTALRILPGTGAAWAFSATGPGGLALYRQIEPLLFALAGQGPPALPDPCGGPAPDRLGAYEGRYRRGGMDLEVRSDGAGALVLSVEGIHAPDPFQGARLRPLSAQVFEAILPSLGVSTRVAFTEFDATGRPRLFFITERMAARS